MSKMSLPIKIVICVAICVGVGALTGLATVDAIPNWYAGLNKPSFNPPNYVFGPVWTILYIMMGVAAALIWNEWELHQDVPRALALFGIQLVLNGLWTIVFFSWHQTGWALIVIAALWILIFVCIMQFRKIQQTAAWLLIPYLAWVSFASLLNFEIWRLN